MSKQVKKSTKVQKMTIGEFHKKLQKQVVDTQAFRNPNISLKVVADMIGVLPRYLTVIVSETEGCNFATFIAKNRLKFGAHLLLKKENLSIKEVAEESGFSNLNTFQRGFKAVYGVSPGIYRQSEGITADLLSLIDQISYEEFAQVLLKAYPKLSNRELKISYLSCKGTTPEEQAEAVGTTKDTIEVTRSRLRKKLALKRTDLLDMKILSVIRKHFKDASKE